MSRIITQNDLDAKLVSDSISNFFARFYIAKELKQANAKNERFFSCEHLPVSFPADLQWKINVYGLPDGEDGKSVC